MSTLVYRPAEAVYDFLLDFPRYADYSEYLSEVRRYGDGGEGSDFDIVLAWWRLSYVVKTQVVELDRPRRIHWRIREDIDASGYWAVEPEPESARQEGEPATRVRLYAAFDPSSARTGALDLPRFVSVSRVLKRVKPILEREATKTCRRIVADLEGTPRSVDLEIHIRPNVL